MSKERRSEFAPLPKRHTGEVCAVAGELAGAVVGSAAGPVGAMAGMVFGAAAGALAGTVLEDEGRRTAAHDAELDRAIGVIGGDLGAGRDFAADLATLTRARFSSRGPFDPERAVPLGHVRRILEASRWAPTAHNMQNFEIVVVDQRALLDELSRVPTETSEVFVEENYAQLSFSYDELRRKKVGLLASSFPTSWRTPGARSEDALAPGVLGEPVRMCAALLVVLYDPRKRAPASEGDALGMMSLGCVMANMWLAAQSLGVGFHVQSVFGNERIQPRVKEILGIPEPLRIAFAVRLGYPLAAGEYLRVRRDVADFVHDNAFGKPWGAPERGAADGR